MVRYGKNKKITFQPVYSPFWFWRKIIFWYLKRGVTEPNVVAHVFHQLTRSLGRRMTMSLRLVWNIQWVPGQPVWDFASKYRYTDRNRMFETQESLVLSRLKLLQIRLLDSTHESIAIYACLYVFNCIHPPLHQSVRGGQPWQPGTWCEWYTSPGLWVASHLYRMTIINKNASKFHLT